MSSLALDMDTAEHSEILEGLSASTTAGEKDLYDIENSREKYDELDGIDSEDEDIPYDVLRPTPQQQSLPPMPDLRFQESYLKSISAADTWWKVLLITARDQVLMPLGQGLVYNLLLCGWQHWNRSARLHGDSVGARFRRWWWNLNDWKIPSAPPRRKYQ